LVLRFWFLIALIQKEKKPKEIQEEPEFKEDLKEKKIKDEVKEELEKREPSPPPKMGVPGVQKAVPLRVQKKEEITEKPPQPIEWVMSEQERRDRPKAITQFEKGIWLYYKRRYQEAIIEFQKVVDNYSGTVIDVTHKAKQYIKFCNDDLGRSKPPLDMELSKEG